MAISVSRTIITPDTDSWLLDIPAGSADDLLKVNLGADAGNITWPTGFTELVSSAGADPRVASAYKKADGTEGSTITVTLSAAQSGAGHVYRIPAAEWHGTTAPEVSGVTNASSLSADLPSFNPAGWDVEATIWFFVIAADTDLISGVSSYPTNYTTGIFDKSGDTGQDAGLATGYRINEAASEDPDALTWTGSADGWRGVMVAVRPAAVVAGPPLGSLALMGAGR